jgi:predicted ATPase
VLAEALATADKIKGRHYEAKLYRLRGELTLRQSGVRRHRLPTPSSQTEAKACFLKAIEVARYQEAKLWELRATMSLARPWQHQGKKEEAHEVLSEIYGWFTEGFDTQDLKDAKALLEDLSKRMRTSE